MDDLRVGVVRLMRVLRLMRMTMTILQTRPPNRRLLYFPNNLVPSNRPT